MLISQKTYLMLLISTNYPTLSYIQKIYTFTQFHKSCNKHIGYSIKFENLKNDWYA